MEQQIIEKGGLQYVPQIAVQYVYLDFDGELTSYNGEILTIDNVEVQDSSLTGERIADIVAELNARYAAQNVIFLTERPETAEYSTIYIGKTSAFDEYGKFAGLAETIDEGNQNKSDNAFVMLDSAASDEQIISTISHEADHLLGVLNHGGEGLDAYACTSHAEILSGSWNGSNFIWYIGHNYILTPYGFSRCANSNCTSTTYYFDNISGATLTNGTYGIHGGHYISSSTIGNGAHVGLQEWVSSQNGVVTRYYAYGDSLTVTSGGVLHIGTTCSATNITLHSSGGIAHGWTDNLLTHHGSDAAFITDFNQGAQVSGRIENFDFNGELYAVGAQLDHVTVGREPSPNGGYFYGYLHMQNGAKASDTTVIGNMLLSSGTSAVNTTVTENGRMIVYDEAEIDTLTMSAGVTEIKSASIIKGNTVISGGTLAISNHVFTTPLTVCAAGRVYGCSNAVISGAEVLSGGIIGQNSNGSASGAFTASDVTIFNGGSLIVNYQAAAKDVTVSSGGSMFLYGTASNTVIDGGYLYSYDNDAVDYDTVLKSSAVQHFEYATASHTQVSSGAMQSVGYGADAFDVTVYAGGSQIIHGADNYFAIVNNTTVYGVQSAVSNGRLSNTSIYGSQYLGNRVSAYDNHIKDGGILTAGSSAYISGLYVSGNGSAILDSTVTLAMGEILSGGFVSNGYFADLTVHSGGYLKDGAPTAYRGGSLSIQGGGSATGVIFDREDALNVVVASDTLLQATDNNGSAYNVSNGLFSGLIVSNGYDITIANGGTARDITVASDGILTVAGSANNITNLFSGSVSIVSGGNVQSFTNSGALHIQDGGNLDNVVNPYNYGRIYVSSGGNVSNAILLNGAMSVSSGGVALDTIISRGSQTVLAGGTALNTTVNSGYEVIISSGGTATIAFNPWMGTVSSGSGADVTFLERDAGVYYGCFSLLSKTNLLTGMTISSSHSAFVYENGIASRNTVTGYRATLLVSNGGIAVDNVVNAYLNIYDGGLGSGNIFSGGTMHIYNGGSGHANAVVNSGTLMIDSGGIAQDTSLSGSRAYGYISSGGIHRGSLQFESGAYISAYAGSVIDFTVAQMQASDDYLHNNLYQIKGAPSYTITVSENQAAGTYKLAQGASNFNRTITIGNGSINYGSITANGEDLVYENGIFSLDQVNGDLTLTIIRNYAEPELTGNANSITWNGIPGNDFVAEYSKNNFINTLQLETNTNSIDTFGLPAGTYQWRVKAEDGEFFNGENIVSDDTATPQIFVSDDNGDMDLFFGNANGTWEAGYAAEHQGFRNGWTGTKERISLTGKNKIADVFSGSDDANVLVLTDDINGDALFVEDIYTSFGKDAARISQIDEIRAGSGDDIIDMTSQKFAYTGEEMTIRGGLGNDVIWAAGGDNDLFGDAGNDRIVGSTGFDLIVGGAGNDSMHSGGGNDIFAFCENWGVDTVQLTDSDSSITLWFASGSESNWDYASRTYRNGSNSVSVIGGTGCTINLKFGDVGGQYDDMVSVGAFESATSEKIFEDKNSGMLA